MWDRDSPLLQLPGVSSEAAARCEAAGISNVYDLAEAEDEARREALGLPVSANFIRIRTLVIGVH